MVVNSYQLTASFFSFFSCSQFTWCWCYSSFVTDLFFFRRDTRETATNTNTMIVMPTNTPYLSCQDSAVMLLSSFVSEMASRISLLSSSSTSIKFKFLLMMSSIDGFFASFCLSLVQSTYLAAAKPIRFLSKSQITQQLWRKMLPKMYIGLQKKSFGIRRLQQRSYLSTRYR